MKGRGLLLARPLELAGPPEVASRGGPCRSGCVIRRVRTRRDLSAFIDLPYRLHRQRPGWVPPFRRDQRRLLDRSFNPFFGYGEAAYFLAEHDGRVVGRVAAIENRRHNRFHEDRTGFFGFFESIDDARVAQALLTAAADWSVARGLTRLRGPVSFSMHQQCGLLVEGFELPPLATMPYSPPYYEALLEAAGLAPVRDLLVYRVESPDRCLRCPRWLDRLVSSREGRSGVELRPCDPRHLDREAVRLSRILASAWEGSWGFVRPTEAEVDGQLRALGRLGVPDLLVFAVAGGRDVGCALALPDLGHRLASNRSGRLFPAALGVLGALGRRRFDTLRVLLLGVLPEFRCRGIEARLYHRLWRSAGEYGVARIEAGWVLDDNQPMRTALEKMGFEPGRRFRLFESASGPSGERVAAGQAGGIGYNLSKVPALGIRTTGTGE